MADFIVELTPNEEETQLDLSFSVSVPLEALRQAPTWDLYMDEFSNDGKSGAGFVLSLPEPKRVRIEYALRFKFNASNK